jgi:hypothetical protein
MSDNITPIRPTPKPRRQKRAARQEGLLLRDSAEGEGFTTLDLVNGLYGVCKAADQLVVSTADINIANELVMAAKILSSILASRVEI